MLGVVVVASVEILGCKYNTWTKSDLLRSIEQLIDSGRRDYVCTVNVAILMMMRHSRRLARFISRSGMVVADGQPVIWASRWTRDPLPERITGVDLVPDLAEMAERHGWGIYLLGSTSEVVTGVADRLTSRFPRLVISGTSDGYFDSEEERRRVEDVRKSGAKLLVVAMGVPRQEYFIEENWAELGVNLAIGVGGSFDVIAGLTRRAPVWMQNFGLEWLFRTIQEPRRLFMRYLTTNSAFIYLFLKEIAIRRENLAVLPHMFRKRSTGA